MSKAATKAVLPASISNPDGSITVKLKNRVQFGEEIIEELKFARPKAKHLRGLDLSKMSTDDMIALISKLTAQFPQAIDEMEIEDFLHCVGVINDFLPDTAKSGKMV